MARGKVISDLAVRVGADTGELRRGLAESKRATTDWGNIAKKASAVFVVAIGAATAAVGALTKKGLQLGDDLAKTAKSVGLTATQLAGWRHVAGLAGVETSNLDNSIVRLGKSIGEAKKGLTTAQDAFGRLGLQWQELQNLPLDQTMLKVAKAMEGVTRQSDKLSIANDLFGRGAGARMLILFDQQTEAIRGQLKEAKDLGYFMDNTQSRVVQDAVDAQQRLKTAFEGLSLQLASAAGPGMERMANALATVVAWVSRAIPKLQVMAERLWDIKAAAVDLGDTTIDLDIADVTQQLKETAATLERANTALPPGSSGPGAAQIQKRINELMEKRVLLTARLYELEQERAKRKDIVEQPPLPLPDIDVVDLYLNQEDEVTDGILQKRLELSAGLVDDLRQRLKTEEQLENDRFRAQIAALEEQHIMTEGGLRDYHQLIEAAVQEHQDKLTQTETEAMTKREQFEAMTAKNRAKFVLSSLEDMSSGVAQHSKKMFKINKLAAIGNAVMNTAESVSRALKDFPVPINFAMAALNAAAGAAQIQAIKNTTFEGGGGGTTPSAAGSTPTVNGQPAPAQLLRVEGLGSDAIFTGAAVRALAQRLIEHQRDGGEVVLE